MKELVMDRKPNSFREAVGVFTNAEDLQAAIDELLDCGFDRAELSLLAGKNGFDEKLGSTYANAGAVGDNPDTVRTTYVSPEAIADAQGGMVGILAYAGATIAAGAVVISGGTIVAAIVTATLAGGAGGIVGSVLAKWLGDRHAKHLQMQIDQGGLLLWVRTRDANAEVRAVDILTKHSSRDVHVHTLSLESAQV
jgi:hypothetical protein